MDRDTKDLIQRMRQGDPAGFQDVFTWYSKDVLRLAFLLLRDPEEAKDVLQETMLSLVRLVRDGRFRGSNGSIKGFLMIAARNDCINRLKKRKVFSSLPEEDEFVPASLQYAETPGKVMNDSLFENAFDHALAKLTEMQRTILVLHEVEGESQSQIAELLDLTVENVRMQLCRARKKMRQWLRPFIGER